MDLDTITPCLVQMTCVDSKTILNLELTNCQLNPKPATTYISEKSVVVSLVVPSLLAQMLQRAKRTLSQVV